MAWFLANVSGGTIYSTTYTIISKVLLIALPPRVFLLGTASLAPGRKNVRRETVGRPKPDCNACDAIKVKFTGLTKIRKLTQQSD